MGQEAVEIGGGIIQPTPGKPLGIVDCGVNPGGQWREVVTQPFDVIGQTVWLPQIVADLCALGEGSVAPLEVQEQPDFEAGRGYRERQIATATDARACDCNAFRLVAIDYTKDLVEVTVPVLRSGLLYDLYGVGVGASDPDAHPSGMAITLPGGAEIGLFGLTLADDQHYSARRLSPGLAPGTPSGIQRR